MSELPEKRNIVLGITGSIAAYKSAELARLLVTRGYQVRVVMTEAAQKFISPLTMESLTGNPVISDFWQPELRGEIGHIEVADWADVLVIAPATADIIAKLAHGVADDPLLAMALVARAPLLIAPAMNVQMLQHPATIENVDILRRRGAAFVEPEEGDLACGWKGAGRLASPWEIFYHVRRALTHRDFAGKKVLITTGPTREPIDPVRFISNRSSGKMGVALAREAFCRGAEVTLIHGPAVVAVPREVRCEAVTTAEEMYRAVLRHTFEAAELPDIVIMSAAVADFRPRDFSVEKVKKISAPQAIELAPNPDILLELGKRRDGKERPVLVGFAVETGEIDELLMELRNKLVAKRADLMIGNFAQDAFDLDTNRVWLMERSGKYSEVSTTFKSRVANKILDVVQKL